MTKEKLELGKPYVICHKTDNTYVRISGSALTKDDVNDFIKHGYITKGDVNLKKATFPTFKDVAKIICDKLKLDLADIYNLYNNYPSQLISMMLKEFGNIVNTPEKGDGFYLVDITDLDVVKSTDPGVTRNLLSYFRDETDARKAVAEIIRGLTNDQK